MIQPQYNQTRFDNAAVAMTCEYKSHCDGIHAFARDWYKVSIYISVWPGENYHAIWQFLM